MEVEDNEFWRDVKEAIHILRTNPKSLNPYSIVLEL